MMAHPILVVVSFEAGRGGGHLVRGAALTRGLRACGREAFLLIKGERSLDDARQTDGADLDALLVDDGELERRRWAFVVLDRFATPEDEWRRYRALGAIIALDEGGRRRGSCAFLIDLLPQLPQRGVPNLSAPTLLTLPQNRKSAPFSLPSARNIRVLIVFGIENAGGLAPLAARALAALSLPAVEMTLITGIGGPEPDGGADFAKDALRRGGGWAVFQRLSGLRERLAAFDIVITHFGLTAFESLAAGAAVILVSPSRYHERLARCAGFFSCGMGARGVRRLARLFRRGNFDAVFNDSRAVAERFGLAEARESLAKFIAALEPQTAERCPVCGGALSGAAARFAERTYRRCLRCAAWAMSRAAPPPITYSDAYFFEDYARQYGKTYLEDFSNLTAMARRRLRIIARMRGGAGGGAAKKRLLDIGCAYGPFLAAARDTGFEPLGIDPSEGAARYVSETLDIPALHGFFPAALDENAAAPRRFDVVSLWYVIEHLREPQAALKKIHAMLSDKGILAFSTPSSSGVSGIFSTRRFLEQSPADHWTIWNPRTIRAALRRAGFDVKKIVITGHHGERLPVFGALFRRGAGRRLWTLISTLFALGDTFEVYARKRA